MRWTLSYDMQCEYKPNERGNLREARTLKPNFLTHQINALVNTNKYYTHSAYFHNTILVLMEKLKPDRMLVSNLIHC